MTEPMKYTAADIMQTSVLTVSESTPLVEVERLLSEHRIGGAPVTDEAGHIVGVVSMRDLLERYSENPEMRPRWSYGLYDVPGGDADGDDYVRLEIPDSSEETARDVMTAQVHSVAKTAGLPEVARRMVELKVHRILVEEDRRHVGLITTFDVLRALGGD